MKTVLIVDRYEDMLDLLLFAFKKYGNHNFLGTTDGQEAIDLLKANKVDLIISGTKVYIGPMKHEFVNVAYILNKNVPIVLHTNNLTASYLHTTYFPKCSANFFRYVEEFLNKAEN